MKPGHWPRAAVGQPGRPAKFESRADGPVPWIARNAPTDQEGPDDLADPGECLRSGSGVSEPAGAGDHVFLDLGGLSGHSPGQRMHDPPASYSLTVEVELLCELVEPAAHPLRWGGILDQLWQAVPQQGSGVKRRFTHEWLGIDRQPLLLGAQNVSAMEILMNNHKRFL